jgi:Na+/phosphate symporter
MIELPPTSAWFFFVLHLLAAMTHLVSVTMTLSPIGKKAGLRVRTRVAGIMSHGGAAALHVLLGLNSFFNWSLRNPDGTVPFHSMFVVVMITIGLPLYLYFAQADVIIQAKKKRESELL